jgi:uncharacterized membrane protein
MKLQEGYSTFWPKFEPGLFVEEVRQAGGSTQDCRLCSVFKKNIYIYMSRNPKKWKPDAIWQNFLRKAMAHKGLSCQL